MPVIGLFIGRFQPFHKAHQAIIENMLNSVDFVKVGIGSSQYSRTKMNPFSFEERKRMIRDSLGFRNYEIYSIPDIHNPPKWAEHVRSIVGRFDTAYAHNHGTLKLFRDAGIKTHFCPYIKGISGRRIRKRMLSSKNWRNLVPKGTLKVLSEINAVRVIKEIYR